MSAVLADFKQAFRTWRHAPWYVTTVIGVLTVGIALTTVAFAVVDGVLFKPLPFQGSRDLYLLHADAASNPRTEPPPVSFDVVNAWREGAPDLATTVISYEPRSGDPRIDERFFDVVGMRPIIGGFSPEDFDWYDDRDPNAKRVRPVLISYRRWLDEYGADASVVGRTTLTVERPGFTAGIRIVGVLPPDFVFPLDVGSTPPTTMAPLPRQRRSGPTRSLFVVGRVSHGVSTVADRLTAAMRARPEPPLSGHVPTELRQRIIFDRVHLVRLDDHLARHVRPAFSLVFAGAAVLLLLACVNVAGLVGARNVERQRDIAVRRSLGASTATLLRGLLAELLVLAVIATGAALLIARPLLLWTLDLLPDTVPLLKEPAIDGRVFAAATLVAVTTALLVALWPARLATNVGVNAALGRTNSGATRRTRRSALPFVGAQIALGFVLLTAGALTVSSLARAWRNDAGFHRDRMILLETYVTRAASNEEMPEKLAAIPPVLESVDGVAHVAISTIGPLFAQRGPGWSSVVPNGWKGKAEGILSREVSANFFDVMGLRLVEGRLPSPGEWSALSGAVVSEQAARILWPGESAVGRMLVNQSGRVRGQRIPVIGVVADTRFAALDEVPTGDIYLPDPIVRGRYGVFFHVRTTEAAGPMLPRILAALSGRGLTFEQASTHEDALFASIRHRALPAWLFGSLGLGALVVLGAGVLALLAMTAAQRTREMGIRIALGATRARVVGMLLREQLTAVALGIVVGALASAWSVRLLRSQLYAVDAYDPSVWSVAALLLVSVAAGGTLVPSLRAASTDPVRALRAE